MAGIFNAEIFNNAIFNTEIGLVEEPGIGLAPAEPQPHHPVDFVFSDGYMIGFRPFFRAKQIRLAQRQDADAELQEMHELYTRWKKAA